MAKDREFLKISGETHAQLLEIKELTGISMIRTVEDLVAGEWARVRKRRDEQKRRAGSVK